jgi:ABC-type bacteriocin/lantibiotic exporter with double-glycine peptidase domain
MSLKHHFERIGGALKHAVGSVRRLAHQPTVLLDVPARMQMDGYCCGLCSARMVAEYHGVYITHSRVERFAKQNRDGTDTKPMVAFLRANGFSVRRYAEGEARIATLIDALKRELPVIVSIPEHYLVVIGYSRSYFYVHDPSVLSHPTNTVLRSDFRRRWTREALIVTRTTSRHKRKATKKLTK